VQLEKGIAGVIPSRCLANHRPCLKCLGRDSDDAEAADELTEKSGKEDAVGDDGDGFSVR